MNNITQAQWIREYNDSHREKFNPYLFDRDDSDVIEALKNVILSCQRDLYFTIKVTNFRVVEDYDEIQDILYKKEQEKLERNKNNKNDNPYNYIDMKDSDILLLIVDYFIAINDPENPQQSTMQIVIKVPRIVDKYYYRIGGNYFLAIYQIVDGSTYNNTNSSSKKQSVTFKTIFMPTRLYRNMYETEDYNHTDLRYVQYTSRIFNKNIPVVEYFLGKFGLFGTLEFLGLDKVVKITDYYNGLDEECYYFNRNNIYIEVPKYIFDRDLAVQCTVMTIFKHINNKTANKENEVKSIYGREIDYSIIKERKYWLEFLAMKFDSKPSAEKGLSVLDSLESIYDINTYESIRLPDEDKATIYHILRWMMRQFSDLRLKDNTDISTKIIRREKYIAAILATKISKGIYRISDSQRKITIEDIIRYINIDPNYLINMIVKDRLVGFRNSVNDNDAIDALKYSYKGISGLGDANSTNVKTSIPDSYRHVHLSHLGRVDPDTSSATDPGLSGIICPLTKIYKESFSDENYMEPNDWDENFNSLVREYVNMRAKRDLVIFKQSMSDEIPDLLDIGNEELQTIDSCIAQQEVALRAINDVDNTTSYNEGTITNDGVTIIYF